MDRIPPVRIYDVTLPFSPALPVWPGDPAIELRPLARTAEGDSSNTSQIICPTHCGTHVDPPRRFFTDGTTLDDLPLERWVGPCQVVQIPDHVAQIEPADLEAAQIDPAVTRLLVKTSNSKKWRTGDLKFETDYVALSLGAVRWLIERGIKLIGVDYLSFEAYHSNGEVHQTLLGNDVVAIEGLDLTAVEPGFYQLVCLPLNVKEGDGAPARVILMSYDN